MLYFILFFIFTCYSLSKSLNYETSNFKLQTSNFKLQTSNFKLQTSNFKLLIFLAFFSNQLMAQTPNTLPLTGNVGVGTTSPNTKL
ncbi:MAG: hypothetical protein CO118_08200, partial [Flavobacteriales bacterium CG_4_9_14_3_um_filter_32_8]